MTTFLVFLLGYMLSQFYRTFIAVISGNLAADLSLSSGDLANISAAWFLVFALAQFPVGVALDRIGPRRTVPPLMLCAATGAVLFARAESGWQCILANGLIGLGCSPIYMGALYVFGRTRPERFGFLTASMLGLGTFGNLMSSTPLAMAAAAWGWRSTGIIVAGVTLVSALLIGLYVKDLSRAQRPQTLFAALAGTSTVLAIRALWPLLPFAAIGGGVMMAERALWVGPYFARVHGLGLVDAGNATLAMSIAMTIGALSYGALDRVPGRRKRLIATGALLSVAGFSCLWLWPQPPLAVGVGLLVFIGVVALSYPLLMAHARAFLPDSLLGRGITFINFLTIGGAGGVQWLSGIYVTHFEAMGATPATAFAALHLAFGAVTLVAIGIYLFSQSPTAEADAAPAPVAVTAAGR